eukprot:CAMPEP_0114416650 /NCGR_PEP_ID=MMETSP0103-20121206/2541_1 /TAXON_ID=37642 ORGANISM="Paraphysomonas imperforata, Strain PA2" /NCGR_SAMPLE_ID=MMETSP0103 /ASSEMBLY_ACC=CAM_ASM_000201 /LENGTH=190 /DNA_ID=CAMNT_0001584885 /DNA_START=40 /DNA_END=612 /DNA_ORIENTATION=-
MKLLLLSILILNLLPSTVSAEEVCGDNTLAEKVAVLEGRVGELEAAMKTISGVLGKPPPKHSNSDKCGATSGEELQQVTSSNDYHLVNTLGTCVRVNGEWGEVQRFGRSLGSSRSFIHFKGNVATERTTIYLPMSEEDIQEMSSMKLGAIMDLQPPDMRKLSKEELMEQVKEKLASEKVEIFVSRSAEKN